MIWVAYDKEGIPEGVFDTAEELARFKGITRQRVYQLLSANDASIFRFKESVREDEEDYGEMD